MINIEQLKKDYSNWYQSQIIFEKIQDRVIQVAFPFLDHFGDEISFYITESNDHQIKITDDGWALNALAEQGINLNRSKPRQLLLDQELKRYGVQLEDNDLVIATSKEELPLAINRFLQSILFTNNMFMLASPNTSNIFLSDLSSFFEKNNIRATPGVTFQGNSGLTHKFDFLISGFKDIPTRLIKTLTISKNDSMFAKAILTDVMQTRLIRESPTSFYVFINDFDRTGKKLTIDSDILTLFSQNQIKPVKYSERNQVVAELAK